MIGRVLFLVIERARVGGGMDRAGKQQMMD
jgi:hypothetical protein